MVRRSPHGPALDLDRRGHGYLPGSTRRTSVLKTRTVKASNDLLLDRPWRRGPGRMAGWRGQDGTGLGRVARCRGAEVGLLPSGPVRAARPDSPPSGKSLSP